MNEAGTGIGLMPHPDNMIEPLHGKTDCRPPFESLLAAITRDYVPSAPMNCRESDTQPNSISMVSNDASWLLRLFE